MAIERCFLLGAFDCSSAGEQLFPTWIQGFAGFCNKDTTSDHQFNLTLLRFMRGIELDQVLPCRQRVNITLCFSELARVHPSSRRDDGVVGFNLFVVPGFAH